MTLLVSAVTGGARHHPKWLSLSRATVGGCRKTYCTV